MCGGSEMGKIKNRDSEAAAAAAWRQREFTEKDAEIKRLKGELAKVAQQQEQAIVGAYQNGVLDSRHAHAVVTAHAAPKQEQP